MELGRCIAVYCRLDVGQMLGLGSICGTGQWRHPRERKDTHHRITVMLISNMPRKASLPCQGLVLRLGVGYRDLRKCSWSKETSISVLNQSIAGVEQ
jgi:hypothetical protein